MINWLSPQGVAFYQNFISPRKGYRCAYGVLNNTHGCSGAVRAIIKEKGVMAGWGDINSQFNNCKAAAEILQAQSGCKKKRRNCKSRFKREASCGSGNCGSGCHVPDCIGCGDIGGCDVGSFSDVHLHL